MSSPRVVVTGVGTVNPLGLTAEEFWKNAVAGISGIGLITRFDATNFYVKVAGEVKGFDAYKYIDPKIADRNPRAVHYGLVAAREAMAQSGIDIIVAQGHDGGGHNAPIGTMALIPQVVDVVGTIPVLGAGGIADGRGIAAAFMLGAEGVWLGSAFLATDEAGLLDFQKQVIVDGIDESTTVSRCITGKPARVFRAKWQAAWEETELEPLPMPFQSMVSMPVLAAAAVAKRKDIAPGFAGQALGLIHAVRPAAAVLNDLVSGAERALAAHR